MSDTLERMIEAIPAVMAKIHATDAQKRAQHRQTCSACNDGLTISNQAVRAPEGLWLNRGNDTFDFVPLSEGEG